MCPGGALMSLIDAAFVGHGSSLELAALGPASTISTRGSSWVLLLHEYPWPLLL